MKLSLNCLQSYFIDAVDWDKVWDRLTSAGIEIEDIKSVGSDFSGVVIARVIDCVQHPDADKLKVCTVDAGDSEKYQIVCGAANVTTGVVVPCAKIGAVLPGGLTILERKMRGLTSFGMLCAGDEIGVADTADGLLLLPSDAPIGMSIREYLDLNDQIVEFKITPNRGDCLSIKGIVREIAMLMDYKTKEIASIREIKSRIQDKVIIENKEPTACPNYATIILKNVNNKVKLPEVITKSLERSGIRSISPIVDLTNFVMLETGQPLHAFDLDKVGNKLIVRFANENEKLKLLNDECAILKNSTLIIADEKNQPAAIAGVMGGLDSGVTSDTVNIVIECAFFEPEFIAGIAKQYGAFSESASRFERGVDYGMQQNVIAYIAALIQKYCGGDAGEVTMSTKSDLAYKAKNICVPFTKIKQLIGIDIAEDKVLDILNALEFNATINNGIINVIAPTFRFDINIAEDVVEEIARCYGYDNIPAIMPTAQLTFKKESSVNVMVQNLKGFMVAHGFVEIVSYAFIEDKFEKMMGQPTTNAIKLQNPIANLNVMRTSLIADLIKSFKHNLSYGHKDIKLFEIGRVFLGEDIATQPLKLSGLISGNKYTANGLNKPCGVDFYDLKAISEAILFAYPEIRFVPCHDYSVLHSGQCAKIYSGNVEVGIIGSLHPKICQELSLNDTPYVFELNLDCLQKLNHTFNLKNINKFPLVERDLAFVLDKKINVGEILSVISTIPKLNYLVDYGVFDIYAKEDSAAKSVAINFVFQADKTLTDDEIRLDMDIITNTVCDKFSATIRS